MGAGKVMMGPVYGWEVESPRGLGQGKQGQEGWISGTSTYQIPLQLS